MESPAAIEAAPAQKAGLLARCRVLAVAKVLLYVVLLAVALHAYCNTMLVLRLLHTMLFGWSIMLDGLIQSGVLQGPEQLEELLQVILTYTGGI